MSGVGALEFKLQLVRVWEVTPNTLKRELPQQSLATSSPACVRRPLNLQAGRSQSLPFLRPYLTLAVDQPVRNLAKPEVVTSAAIAALAVAVVCYPRLTLWPNRSYPIWYLEAVLTFGGFVLWAFVFAWHTKFTGQPVFNLKLTTKLGVLATLAGIIMTAILHWFVDPLFRASTPEDYPADFRQWIAMTLFSLGFTQLFLVFAPFDWSVRLSRRRWFAMLFTVLFGVFVLMVKTRSSPTQLAPSLFWLLIIIRAVISFFSVWFYSRHGVILAWWWGFLLQTRHLVSLTGGS